MGLRRGCAAADAKLVAHSTRSQRKLCIKVSSPRTKPTFIARAPLSLCFTILVALPRHDVTLNALRNAESYLWTVFTKIYRHCDSFDCFARENAVAVSLSVDSNACSRISTARSADTTDKSIRIIVASRKSQFEITANFLPATAKLPPNYGEAV